MCELFQRLHVYGRWTWGPVCLNEGWPQSTNTWLIQLRPHSKCVPLDGILRISRRRTREIFALCLPFSHHISLSLSLFSLHAIPVLSAINLILNLSSGSSTGLGSCTWSVSTAVSRVVGERGWRWWGMSQIITPSTERGSWPRNESTSAGTIKLFDCVVALMMYTWRAIRITDCRVLIAALQSFTSQQSKLHETHSNTQRALRPACLQSPNTLCLDMLRYKWKYYCTVRSVNTGLRK